jgi:hypothetical protein
LASLQRRHSSRNDLDPGSERWRGEAYDVA